MHKFYTVAVPALCVILAAPIAGAEEGRAAGELPEGHVLDVAAAAEEFARPLGVHNSDWDVELIECSYPDTVTEDGVTGYEYVYDLTTDGVSGRYLGFHGFDGSRCAWVRTHPYYGITGVWQKWGNLSAGHNVWYHWGWVWYMDEAGAPSVNDGTGQGWSLGVDHYGDFVVPGQTFPWAMKNRWHDPDEYNWGYELYMPTTAYVPLSDGLSWDGIWGMSAFGQDAGIMLTIRIVHPNPPGGMYWSSDAGCDGWTIGPTGELDDEPPVIESITADPDKLWPANHKMVTVNLSVSSTDNIDPAPVSAIVGVTVSDENGGDGNTDNDIGTIDGLSVELRAERSAKGGGRTYTITVECTDAGGNSSTADVEISVPHDKRKKQHPIEKTVRRTSASTTPPSESACGSSSGVRFREQRWLERAAW
jgi:hypothetical protein